MSENAYTAHVHLRWGDMDALRHINNTQFVRILEEARVRWISDVFPSRGSGALLIARHEIEYTAQLAYQREPVAVAMWVTRLGGSSFDVGCEIRSAEDGPIHALAETTLVHIDTVTGSSAPLGDEVRALLEGFAGPRPAFRARS